jgi:hypothetical protein
MRTALLALLVVFAAGCPKPRTAAATQPTPAAFDPAASEAKALETVDAGLAAIGGRDKWDAVKELRFTVKYSLDGQLKSWTVHMWDRWNGRHNFQAVNLETLTGKPDDMRASEVRYDLFDSTKKPYATYAGQEIMRAEADKAADQAKKRLNEEGYLFTLIHKVRDPGVHLASLGETKTEGACEPSCTTIKVTFDPGVGKDTWYVNYNATTKLPEVIESDVAGKGRIGYKIDGWVEAGGLKFPAKLQNLGLKGEIFEFSGVSVGEPDDNDYMRNVNE